MDEHGLSAALDAGVQNGGGGRFSNKDVGGTGREGEIGGQLSCWCVDALQRLAFGGAVPHATKSGMGDP